MKKILLIFVILGALASVAGCILGLSASEVLASPNRINGSGYLIARTIPAPDFETVSSACGVTVLITDDNTDRIRIEADDNLMEYVVVEERQGTLRVALDQGRKGARSVSNAHVTVTVPSNGKIRALKASSASQIVCRTALGADDFSIETSSAAKVEAAVKAGKCSLDASSASKIVAALDVEECRADHPFGQSRPIPCQPQLGRQAFGRRTRRRDVLDRHLERLQSLGALLRNAPRQRLERFVDPLLGRLLDPPEQIERRQHPQLNPFPKHAKP